MKKAFAAVLIEKKKFELKEFDLPEIKNDDGLLEVEVVGICGTDYSQYLGKMEQLGVRYPVIPGHEIVGKIAKIGEKAEKKWNVKLGDRVAVESLVPCGTCPDCIRWPGYLFTHRGLRDLVFPFLKHLPRIPRLLPQLGVFSLKQGEAPLSTLTRTTGKNLQVQFAKSLRTVHCRHP